MHLSNMYTKQGQMMTTTTFNRIAYVLFFIIWGTRALNLNLEASGKAPCDLSKGKWQMSEKPPLYDGAHVEYIWGGVQRRLCPNKAIRPYAWAPDGCEMLPFDASEFQRLVSQRPIIMFGDSIMTNTFESLRMLVPGLPAPDEDVVPGQLVRRRFAPFLGHMCKQMYPGEGKSTSVGKYTYLDEGRLNADDCDVDLNQFDARLLQDIRNNTIVVLGGGKHFSHRDNIYRHGGMILEDKGGRVNVEALRIAYANVFRELEGKGFTGNVIVQTLSPSHFFHGDWDSGGGCGGFSEPVNDVSNYINLTSESPSEQEEGNSMLRSLTTMSSKFKIHIWDVSAMSWGRADAHPGLTNKDGPNDCVHWCLPGVPDVWNQQLLQILRDLIV